MSNHHNGASTVLVSALWHKQASDALADAAEAAEQFKQAEQILALARRGGSRYVDGRPAKTPTPHPLDIALLRSSGVVLTPTDQDRAGIARQKNRRQAANASRIGGALWRYVTAKFSW